MSYALEIDNLKKVYSGGTEALKGISLKVNEGDFYALLGPNGAGKSSTIGIIGTLVTKTSGNVKIFGIDIDEDVAMAKSMLGVVSQEINFSQFENVIDIVTTQAGFYGIKKSIASPKVENMLKRLGLWDKRNDQARTLSGGYKRRLMIAKALIHEPKLLILDEPTAGVDIDIRKSVWNYIKKISMEGKTICLTTHYLEEAESLCDNITIINHGRKIIEGSKSELLNIISTKTVSFVLNVETNIPKELSKFKPIFKDNILKLSYDKKNTNIKNIIDILIKNKIDFVEINTAEGDLEDVFLKVIQK